MPQYIAASLLFSALLSLAACDGMGRGLRRPAPQPSASYHLDAPTGWTTLDTVIGTGGESVNAKMIYPRDTAFVDIKPAINCIAIYMEGRAVEAFTDRNAAYLTEHNPDVQITDRGRMDFGGYHGTYLRYTNNKNGMPRELVNFIIPVKGFAYMMTCGVNAGYMNEYLPTFEQVAQSFYYGH